ncbi:MAG: hypothetical protein M3R70_13595 [Actinomycetota bacterium]|nr:hypothetical protein [Actinomycetota bacterium]
MVGLIVVGLLLTRVLGGTDPKVSHEQAVQIARPRAGFKPDGHQVRLLRRGIPPKPFWAISFWTKKASGAGYARLTLVLVDASSGRIAEVRRER